MQRLLTLLLVWMSSSAVVLGASFQDMVKRGEPPSTWTYQQGQLGGPDDWPWFEFTCGNMKQSPIDLDPQNLYAMYVSLPVIIKNLDTEYSWTLKNNGRTVQMQPSSDADIKVSGGELIKGVEYKVDHIEFHWGADSSLGSEHTWNGTRFPMEAQVVMSNTRYKDNEAAQRYHGQAILAFWYQISAADNPGYSFTDKLGSIVNADAKVDTGPLSLASLVPALTDQRVITYGGSLSKPPCTESVTWMIFPETLINISESQLAKFRALKDKEGMPMVDNFRPVQPFDKLGRVFDSYA